MARKSSKLNVRKIAQELGLSPAAVSLALRDDPSVSEETRKRVLEKAIEMGYVPSGTTRGSVGLAVNTLSSFVPDLIKGILDALPHGGALLRVYTPSNIEETAFFFYRNGIRRLIIQVVEQEEVKMWESALYENISAIFVAGNTLEKVGMGHIWVDGFRGAYEAARYLIKKAREKFGVDNPSILFVAFEGTEHAWSDERMRGYMAAMGEVGLKPEVVSLKSFDVEENQRRLKAFLKNKRFHAIQTAADVLAVPALFALQELGVKVPEETLLMGFDDIEFAGLLSVPLTTMKIPAFEMGRTAVSLSSSNFTGEILMVPKLVKRKSA